MVRVRVENTGWSVSYWHVSYFTCKICVELGCPIKLTWIEFASPSPISVGPLVTSCTPSNFCVQFFETIILSFRIWNNYFDFWN